MDHVEDLGRDHARGFDAGGPRKKPKVFSVTGFLTKQPKKMAAIYPLFGMVAVAFGLAGLTMARHLAVSPAVTVDKKKRVSDEIHEMKYPGETANAGKAYTEGSPLYKLAKGTKPSRAIAGAQQLPTVLPGDETSARGVQGTYVDRGKRGGGI